MRLIDADALLNDMAHVFEDKDYFGTIKKVIESQIECNYLVPTKKPWNNRNTCHVERYEYSDMNGTHTVEVKKEYRNYLKELDEKQRGNK